ncbi:YhcN/YlaJ family sporulation lipoprotein [Mesobacillus jeotgali]|uniref:YhcN/YlaJ family sporulation lipoprotein n=1 Tax=Mesobacillus jeotgali TaxID=129985 RepID=UPI0015908D0D|nr:YhcN/YlaJ family sporulation lipoprotein [Mesobacillus jeotgali]
MNKKMLLVPIASLITIGLSACNGDNEAAIQGTNRNQGQPLGYYSNEKGNEIDSMDDREGALTEIFDHNFGKEGAAEENRKRKMLQSRDENGNPPNPTVPRSDHDHNFFQKDNKYSRGDLNYHGHLSEHKGSGKAGIYTNSEQDNKLARKVGLAAESVDNVDKVRSVLFGREVKIAVTYKDKSLKKQTDKKIKNAVRPYTEGRDLRIIEDDGTISRTRNIDYDRKNGNPRESININP